MEQLILHVIIGSVRPNRFGDKPAAWIAELAKAAGFAAEVIDLNDWLLPDYNESGSPGMLKGQFKNTQAMAWQAKASKADAYVIVTPEYNHGYPASLKNALDWTYGVFADKPVGFVAYGTVGGARAVEQLRGVVGELYMADVRGAVHIVRHLSLLDDAGALKPGAFDPYLESAEAMLGQLMRWGKALKVARQG